MYLVVLWAFAACFFICLCCEHFHHLLSKWWKCFLDLLVLFLFASVFWSCSALSSLDHRTMGILGWASGAERIERAERNLQKDALHSEGNMTATLPAHMLWSLLPFWALNVSVALLSMQGQKALGFHQKYLNLCSKDERRSYGFRMTWGWVINDRIFFFGWIRLKMYWKKYMWPWTTKSVLSRWGIFVAIGKNSVYGS